MFRYCIVTLVFLFLLLYIAKYIIIHCTILHLIFLINQIRIRIGYDKSIIFFHLFLKIANLYKQLLQD